MPGELREGLGSLLLASDGVASLIIVDDLRAASVFMEENCPHLLVIDLAATGADLLSELTGITAKCPGSKFLALAEDAAQAATAESEWADIAVIKGFRAAELSATVSKMLA